MGLLVLGLHLALVLAWLSLAPDLPLARSGTALSTLTVWVPQFVPPVEKPTRHTPPRQAQPLERARLGADAAQQPSTDAGTQSLEPSASQGVVIQTPSGAQDSLNLGLSRKDLTALAPSGPAASSPFHGRLPATVEHIIANAAAGSGPWSEERIDNDHIRLRRGNTCVMMERPQAAALDPFSDAARRIPWRASAC